jgi:hypothetical protein
MTTDKRQYTLTLTLNRECLSCPEHTELLRHDVSLKGDATAADSFNETLKWMGRVVEKLTLEPSMGESKQ